MTLRKSLFPALRGMLILGVMSAAMVPVQALIVSKDAQELMKLREQRAPQECELTRLYRKAAEARTAGDEKKVEAIQKRMREIDTKLHPSHARVVELTKRVHGTPDHKAVMEHQIKMDKACR